MLAEQHQGVNYDKLDRGENSYKFCVTRDAFKLALPGQKTLRNGMLVKGSSTLVFFFFLLSVFDDMHW